MCVLISLSLSHTTSEVPPDICFNTQYYALKKAKTGPSWRPIVRNARLPFYRPVHKHNLNWESCVFLPCRPRDHYVCSILPVIMSAQMPKEKRENP